MAGPQEGMFHYAEPGDDGDALCHKLMGVIDLCCRAATLPLTPAMHGLTPRAAGAAGAPGNLEIQFPVC